MNTKKRFAIGQRGSERNFMKRIINLLNRSPEFSGLERNIEKIQSFQKENELQDILIHFRMGIHTNPLSVELQQRTLSEFMKYQQIAIDYVSSYMPYIRYSRLSDFKADVDTGRIKILKRGKLLESKARVLVFYTYDVVNDRIGNIYLYDLLALSRYRNIVEQNGDFRTNIKSKDENWGSAFIALSPTLIENCRIKSHSELIRIIFPQLIK
ncbi:MAG: hypothetical protein JXR46_05840 [Calditrichaceae bacterium]|nr:hypothetical protein [Calditrichaceae bacterium]MBN2708546.1 hypothetical protein [Calditrichaceae bacterium]